MTQSTKFQLFDFLVYTVWACLKGVTPYKALKEESTNRNYCDDNYNAPFACRSFAFFIFFNFSNVLDLKIFLRLFLHFVDHRCEWYAMHRRWLFVPSRRLP